MTFHQKKKNTQTSCSNNWWLINFLLIFLVFVLFGFLKNINLLYNVFISTELKGLIYFLTFVTFIFFTGLWTMISIKLDH